MFLKKKENKEIIEKTEKISKSPQKKIQKEEVKKLNNLQNKSNVIYSSKFKQQMKIVRENNQKQKKKAERNPCQEPIYKK